MKHQATKSKATPVRPMGSPIPPGSIDIETLAILEQWALEDATEDPARLEAARKELDEFKRAMNENRSSTGERTLYP